MQFFYFFCKIFQPQTARPFYFIYSELNTIQKKIKNQQIYYHLHFNRMDRKGCLLPSESPKHLCNCQSFQSHMLAKRKCDWCQGWVNCAVSPGSSGSQSRGCLACYCGCTSKMCGLPMASRERSISEPPPLNINDILPRPFQSCWPRSPKTWSVNSQACKWRLPFRAWALMGKPDASFNDNWNKRSLCGMAKSPLYFSQLLSVPAMM